MPSDERPADTAPTTERHLTSLSATETDFGDGWVASEAVDTNGATTFWLIAPGRPAEGVWNEAHAPHELDGPLPDKWRPRCAATTRATGTGCRNSVRRPGDYCVRHRDGAP
jgi:hypothetical protein